jgi:2-amino-4-hydroxy-6-hydroxymethyldihydropteridine diphosphokinase
VIEHPAPSAERRVRIAIALGSNLGDRHAHLAFATHSLRGLLQDMVVSPAIETAPVGVGPQPDYLNAAAVGKTGLAPRALLEALRAIECARGRARPHAGAARTLDLDLVLYGDDRIDEPGLVVPHPRFRERGFVLEPLAAIAPEMRDPVTGLMVGELLARLRAAGRR